MRWDKQNQLSSEQALTGTAVTTNSYQKQSAEQDISIGRKMALLFIVTTAAGAGSAWTFQAVQADNTGLSSNQEVLASSEEKAAAELTVGAQVVVPFPEGSMDQLHIGGKVVSAGSGTETLSVDCYLVPEDEIPHYKAFPKVVDAAVS